jgi:hypothetical protein
MLTQKIIPLVYFNSVGFNAGLMNFHISQNTYGNATSNPPTTAIVILDMKVPLMDVTWRFSFMGGMQSESPMPST